MALLQVGVQHIFRPVYLTGSSAVILLLNAFTVFSLGHGMIHSASLICNVSILRVSTITDLMTTFSPMLKSEQGNGSIHIRAYR